MPTGVFLLAGQSNMSGRGVLPTEPPPPDPRILCFSYDLNCWGPLQLPVHNDPPIAASAGKIGGCLATAFASALLASPEFTARFQRIGLVPCAYGGSPLSRWQPQPEATLADAPEPCAAELPPNPGEDGDLWRHTVSRLRAALAQPDTELAGVLWHQGETDAGELLLAESVAVRLSALIDSLRDGHSVVCADLAKPVPFLIGELGQFAGQGMSAERCKHAGVVQGQLKQTAEHTDMAGLVGSGGLTHRGDWLHFDTASLERFGRRYAAGWLEIMEWPPVEATDTEEAEQA